MAALPEIDLDALYARAGEVEGLDFLPAEVRERALRAAASPSPILLTGETGTGKGRLARALAAASPRPRLLEVNCAALPEELAASELFGHRKGAFTGATRDREGLLVAARGKTLFLDEVGELSEVCQRMLLRALERTRPTIKPLGADEEVPVRDVRFFFATNRDLFAEAEAGRFREDLLRRIAVVRFHLLPLRAQRDKIPAYLARVLLDLAAHTGLRPAAITRRAYDEILAREWRGNVRELKNAIEYALVTGERVGEDRVRIDVTDLPPEETAAKTGDAPGDETLDGVAARHIARVLDACGGDAARAAERLGLSSKAALYRRMRRLGVPPPLRKRRKSA